MPFSGHPGFSGEEEEIEEGSLEIPGIISFEGQKDELAKNLPYGEQRRLEIVRALATRPLLLILDEPAAARYESSGNPGTNGLNSSYKR